MNRALSRKLIAAGIATCAIAAAFMGIQQAEAATRLDRDVAAAAGRAVGAAADRAVERAVINGASRYKGAACASGARRLRLQGPTYVAFMAECRKIL